MSDSYAADYDNTWKEALNEYFPQFLQLLFPQVYDLIDWNQEPISLDKELQQITASSGNKREADKLFQVALLDNQETWILVHIEVQTQEKSDFAQRMYIYNYIAFDLYERPVISLAILGDGRNNWRPNSYGYALGGSRVSLEFPIVKLLDYTQQWEVLASSVNPFAIIVMAHLKTMATLNQPQEREESKWNLVRNLYQKGYQKQQLIKLFQLIDKMMAIPVELQQSFEEKLVRYEEETKMAIMSNMEERRAKSIAREWLSTVVNLRFGEVSSDLSTSINRIDDLSTLKQLHERAILARSLEEFEEFLNSAQSS